MKKLNLKTTPGANRKDSYTMHPDSINVYWDENPREDYGDEDFETLKAMIRKDKEIINPLFIMPDEKKHGSWKLQHGFRRMRCIQELKEEGVMIEAVPVKQIYSQEEALLLHITLNNSTKALTDVELAKTVREYAKMTQNESPKFLSERTGLPIHKIRILIDFDATASTVLKQAVKNDEVSFNTAVAIASNSTGIEHQNQILLAGKEEAEKRGKKRVTSTIIAKHTGRKKSNKELDRLRNILVIAGGHEKMLYLIDNIHLPSSDLLTVLTNK